MFTKVGAVAAKKAVAFQPDRQLLQRERSGVFFAPDAERRAADALSAKSMSEGLNSSNVSPALAGIFSTAVPCAALSSAASSLSNPFPSKW